MIPGEPQEIPANKQFMETAGIEPAQESQRTRGPRRKPIEERFWPKVNRKTPAECWEWQAHRDHRGYGRLNSPGKVGPVLKAHRVSYELHYGPVPDGLGVLHHCDNPACVNPAHLYAGDQAQNGDDMSRRGRSGVQKYSDAQVRALREAVAEGEPILAAARRFGISESQAHNIVKGMQRRHADGPLLEHEQWPILLVARRAGDAEPVLVAQTSSEVILVLDDGVELRFDQSELRKALDR